MLSSAAFGASRTPAKVVVGGDGGGERRFGFIFAFFFFFVLDGEAAFFFWVGRFCCIVRTPIISHNNHAGPFAQQSLLTPKF